MSFIKLGKLRLLLFSFICVGLLSTIQASESPPDVYSGDGELSEVVYTVDGDEVTYNYHLPERPLYAQANSGVDPIDVIEDIGEFFPDTVESFNDIIDEGLYYIKNVPKGQGAGDWIKWIFGLIGLIVGSTVYVIRNYVKPKKE